MRFSTLFLFFCAQNKSCMKMGSPAIGDFCGRKSQKSIIRSKSKVTNNGKSITTISSENYEGNESFKMYLLQVWLTLVTFMWYVSSPFSFIFEQHVFHRILGDKIRTRAQQNFGFQNSKDQFTMSKTPSKTIMAQNDRF